MNGREATAYFDTGASLSFVSRSLSEELKLPLLESQRRGGNNQDEIKGSESGSFCGLLGMDVLEKKVWTIDGRSGYFSINR